jgi:hypothetical protein
VRRVAIRGVPIRQPVAGEQALHEARHRLIDDAGGDVGPRVGRDFARLNECDARKRIAGVGGLFLKEHARKHTSHIGFLLLSIESKMDASFTTRC